jgi:hypothetical protein
VLVAWSDGTPLPAALQGVTAASGKKSTNGNSARHAASQAAAFHGDDLLVARLDVGAALHLAREAA